MYGVWTTVSVAASAEDPSHTLLKSQIIPAVQAMPGVTGGYWLEVEGKGMSLVLFENEESARAGISAMNVAVGGEILPGVVFEVVEIAEVIDSF
jgi:uncharacterized protein involved in tolerance to divalent cations